MTAEVIVYMRPGCHLCTEAVGDIAAMNPGITVREVDIESDDRLLRKYLELIPVVEVDGRIVSTLVFNPARLREALTADGYAEGND